MNGKQQKYSGLRDTFKKVGKYYMWVKDRAEELHAFQRRLAS